MSRILIGKYEVLETLVCDTLGEIHKCKVLGTDEFVVIKEFFFNQENTIQTVRSRYPISAQIDVCFDRPYRLSIRKYIPYEKIVYIVIEIQKRTISNYELLSQRNEGGTSVIYKAKELDTGKIFALKEQKLDLEDYDQAESRFIQEANILLRLRHKNILQVYKFLDWEGKKYLVMDYLNGDTLKELAGKINPVLVLKYMMQIADALGYIHYEGIIHRDLKPDNMMVIDNQAYLMDFGIAKIMEPTWEKMVATTMRGVIMGTARYLAPEQIKFYLERGKTKNRLSSRYFFLRSSLV